jgi:hypothetical protein
MMSTLTAFNAGKSNTKINIARTVEDDGGRVEIFVSAFPGQ